jgi:hypothetical protein
MKTNVGKEKEIDCHPTIPTGIVVGYIRVQCDDL